MMEPEKFFNPYAAPAPGYDSGSASAAPGSRPGWLTFYCIIAIILGGLGAAGGVTGVGGLAFNRYTGGALARQPRPANLPPATAEMLDAQEEMQKEIFAVEARYFPYLLVAQVGLIAVAAFLLVSGIMALQMTRFGASLLANAFLTASVFDVARLVLTVFYQMEMRQVLSSFFDQVFEAAPRGGQPLPPGMAAMGGTISSVLIGFGVCFAVAWTIVKLLIYLSGWMYLNKPQVQAVLKG